MIRILLQPVNCTYIRPFDSESDRQTRCYSHAVISIDVCYFYRSLNYAYNKLLVTWRYVCVQDSIFYWNWEFMHLNIFNLRDCVPIASLRLSFWYRSLNGIAENVFIDRSQQKDSWKHMYKQMTWPINYLVWTQGIQSKKHVKLAFWRTYRKYNDRRLS